jgi:hypothetical protein
MTDNAEDAWDRNHGRDLRQRQIAGQMISQNRFSPRRPTSASGRMEMLAGELPLNRK